MLSGVQISVYDCIIQWDWRSFHPSEESLGGNLDKGFVPEILFDKGRQQASSALNQKRVDPFGIELLRCV